MSSSNYMMSAANEEQALEQLHAENCTDGLPVIIPTRERVQNMMSTSGLDEDLVVAAMEPLNGAASVLKIATNAVMAGCLPEHFPTVLAAVRAICQPEFDLGEKQCTTHDVTPLVIVNGPVRFDCGFSSGHGSMGPGCRANAAVGRALRLCMINIGGAIPGSTDMALHGQPGKFSLCIAEDEEKSPFPALHTTFGYEEHESAVTVLGVESPHSVEFMIDKDDPKGAERLSRVLALTLANAGSNNIRYGGGGSVAVVLNPEHAEIFQSHGWTRQDVQQQISDYSVVPRSVMDETRSIELVVDGDMMKAVRNPEDVVVLTSGGGGAYSMVFPTWCNGNHMDRVVHHKIDHNPFCEIPAFASGSQ